MSLTTTWAAALLSAVAVSLWLPPRLVLPVHASSATRSPHQEDSPSASWHLLAAAGAGFGVWSFLGSGAGIALGAAAGLGLWWWLGRLEPPATVQRRERLRRQLPTAVDLLAACLDAGAAPAPALRTVGLALGGPVAEELARCGHRLDLGGDPGSVWLELTEHPQLAPLGRAFARSHESGSSVAEEIHHLAEDLRDATRAEVEARARRLEVKVAMPLGLCLLPAFVLLGIVPMVVGLFGSLDLA